MPRYFFHLCDGGDVLLDPDGQDIEDASRIPAIALREARWCISQDALDGRIALNQSIEVRNARGDVVHVLAFADAVVIGPR